MGVYALIFDYGQTQRICKFVLRWLSTKSVGGRATKDSFKDFQEDLWNPILEAIRILNEKSSLNEEEKKFLNLVVYDGNIFRILNYNHRFKKHVCAIQEYQSWSGSIEGLLNIPGMDNNNEKLLIVARADVGIDIFGLIHFIIDNKYIYDNKMIMSLNGIQRYEMENEIAYKTSLDKIERVIVVNGRNLLDYDSKIVKEIPRELWGRKNFDV